jgi:hypothetical protein
MQHGVVERGADVPDPELQCRVLGGRADVPVEVRGVVDAARGAEPRDDTRVRLRVLERLRRAGD